MFRKATRERRIHYLEVGDRVFASVSDSRFTPDQPGSQDGEPRLVSLQLNDLSAAVAGAGLAFGLSR